MTGSRALVPKREGKVIRSMSSRMGFTMERVVFISVSYNIGKKIERV